MKNIRGSISFSNLHGCFSRGNTVFYDFKPFCDVDFIITSIKARHNFIYVSGKTHFCSVTIDEKKIEKHSFDSCILDFFISNKVLIGFLDGSVYNLDDRKFTYNNVTGIVSMKIVSEQSIIFGLYSDVLFCGFKGPSYDIKHEGRVFWVESTDNMIITAGEDRKVNVVDKIGHWEIQEYRNYVVKCGFFNDFVYTIIRDGTLKIYKARKEICKIKTCFMGLSDVFIHGNTLCLGLSNGEILSYELSSGCFLQNSPQNNTIPMKTESLFVKTNELLSHLAIKNRFCQSCKTYKSPNLELKVDNNKLHLIREKQEHNLQFKNAILDVFVSSKTVKLLFKNSVAVLDKNSLTVKREIFVSKPSVVYKSVIGTKNGWIYIGNRGYKVAKSEILDIYFIKSRFYCLTEDKLFLVDVKESSNAKVCGNIVTGQKNSPITIGSHKSIYREHQFGSKTIKLYKNNFIFDLPKRKNHWCEPISCHKHPLNFVKDVYFREITLAIRFKNYFVCGSKEMKVVLFDKIFNICDVIKVDGQVQKIVKYGNTIAVCTKKGCLYLLKVVKRKLFIIEHLMNEFKTLDIALSSSLFVIDSGGWFRTFDYNLKQTNKLFLDSFPVTLQLVKDVCYIGTSEGEILEINLSQGLSINRRTKVSTLSLFSIFKHKKHLYTGGDCHNIIKFNKKIILKKTIVSEQIVQIGKINNHLFILTKSGLLKIIDGNFKLIKKHQVICGVINCIVKKKGTIYCFGDVVVELNDI